MDGCEGGLATANINAFSKNLADFTSSIFMVYPQLAIVLF